MARPERCALHRSVCRAPVLRDGECGDRRTTIGLVLNARHLLDGAKGPKGRKGDKGQQVNPCLFCYRRNLMLRFLMGKSSDCQSLSRRQFLQVGGVSAFGLSLSSLLRSQAIAAEKRRKDVNCIL